VGEMDNRVGLLTMIKLETEMDPLVKRGSIGEKKMDG
jgi:hypothetical protein